MPQAASPNVDRAAVPADFPRPFGRRPSRTFALAIALPAILFYAMSACLVFGALAMMAGEMDRAEDARSVNAMHSALDGFLSGLSDAVADEGTWNEAYLNVVVSPNPAWMDSTWGASARLGNAYDTVLVTDDAGIIQFGEDAVGAIKGDIALRFPAARAMLRNLDQGIASTGDATTVTGFAADQAGTVGIAAISIHQSTPGEVNVPRHLRQILWIVRHITPAVLQDLSVHYQTPLPELVTTVPAGASAIDLRDADGTANGAITWESDRPGESAFGSAAVVAALIFGVIGAIVLTGLGLLRRAILRRAKVFESAIANGPPAAVAAAPAAPEGYAFTTAAEPDPDASGLIEGITPSTFEIAYQPVFDLRAETLVGVEGLLRWTRPDKSVLTQEELAPRPLSALLDRIGILAMRHGSGELAPLLGVTLALTATPAQLQSSVFAEKVAATLRATNLPPGRLQLCIDTTLLPAIGDLKPSIAALKLTGVSLGLSNFTLTSATIPYLKAGLIDRVRLSSQLTSGLDGDPLRLSLLEASVAAARSANLAVTVPAMTQRADVAPLLRLGCREFQGNIFAPPMGFAALTALILAPARKAS